MADRFLARIYCGIIAAILLLDVPAALATQAHDAPEGLYAHQMGHAVFFVAMGLLSYWLSRTPFTGQKGWRHIRYSAIFFMIWNVDTILVHLLDEQTGWIRAESISPWEIKLTGDFASPALELFYYIAKLDHLFCVPAVILLYIGLRRLLKSRELPI